MFKQKDERGEMKDERDSAFGKYKRIAGEVEARNASKRQGMTVREKWESLLSETADVKDEDRIFIADAIASAEMRDERGEMRDGVYSLENAIPSKDGYTVERVNENAGRDLNSAKGVVCETVNQVFDPKDAPEKGFAKWVREKIIAWEENHPVKGAYYTPALDAEVNLEKASLKSIGSHGGPDVKYNLIPVIPDILKNAVLIQTENFGKDDKTFSKSHILASKVRYGENKRYVAVMVIHESNGKFYYDHSLLILYYF